MKIRLLTTNPFCVGVGGMEVQAQSYINYIKNAHPEVDIDFLNWTEKDIDILHILGLNGLIRPEPIDVLKKRGVKIVISPVFYLKPNSPFQLSSPWIYKCCSSLHYTFNTMYLPKLLLQKADVILPNSEEEKKQLMHIYRINDKKIKVLYNGVAREFYKGISETLFKKKYKLNNYILCSSFIDPRKNHLLLIEGFLKYRKEHPESNLKLVLLGGYRNHHFSYNDKVKKLINSSEDILHIENLNHTDEEFKSAYLGCSAHFLLSSLETPGLSNIEAGLAGKKLVLGDCKPVREYFKQYAEYIDANNINNIVKSIENLDPSYNNIEETNFILKNYTWEGISEKLLNIYKTL